MRLPIDLDIARRASLKPIEEIGEIMGLGPHLLEPYDANMAKIKLSAFDELAERPRAIKRRGVVVRTSLPVGDEARKTLSTVRKQRRMAPCAASSACS